MPTPDFTHATWHRSSRSDANGGQCVEVAVVIGADDIADVIGLRDSKDPTGPILTFAPAQWRTFIAAVRANHLPR